MLEFLALIVVGLFVALPVLTVLVGVALQLFDCAALDEQSNDVVN